MLMNFQMNSYNQLLTRWVTGLKAAVCSSNNIDFLQRTGKATPTVAIFWNSGPSFANKIFQTPEIILSMPLHSSPALQPSLSRPFLHIRLGPVSTYMLSDSRTEMQPSLVVSSLNMDTTAEAEDLNITAHFHQIFYFIEEYWDISFIFTNVTSKWGSKCSAFAVRFNQIEGVQRFCCVFQSDWGGASAAHYSSPALHSATLGCVLSLY